jgi:hypothetical protein
MAFELYALAERMVRARVLRENPSASRAEIDAAVDAWASDRSCAPDGDCPGRPYRWR